MHVLEKFIQKTERQLLENPYKLDKQLAALDQVLSDYPRSSKRQRLEVIFHYFVKYLHLF